MQAARTIARGSSAFTSAGALDLAALARVEVSSEQSLYPIDHVFDGQSGPGGSCWVAGAPGPQRIALSFAHPADIAEVCVEGEERGETRTQTVELELWSGEEQRLLPDAARIFRFSPYGQCFHRVTWKVAAAAVTRLCLRVSPVPSFRRASLTSIVLR